MTSEQTGSISTAAANDFAMALHDQAIRDADAVAEFLITRGLVRPSDECERTIFSADQLLGIALSLRLRRWELNGIRVHLDAGLPKSDEVFGRVASLTHGSELKRYVESNWTRSIVVFHESILWWMDRTDLADDIAVVADEDGGFVDAIVDFLLSITSNNKRV